MATSKICKVDGCGKPVKWLGWCRPHYQRFKVHGDQRGESIGSAKLTEADVISIRAFRGTLLQRDIAEMFGVNKSCVSKIHTRKSWAWLD